MFIKNNAMEKKLLPFWAFLVPFFSVFSVNLSYEIINMCTTRSRCGIVQDIIYSHFKNSNCDALCDYASALVHA